MHRALGKVEKVKVMHVKHCIVIKDRKCDSQKYLYLISYKLLSDKKNYINTHQYAIMLYLVMIKNFISPYKSSTSIVQTMTVFNRLSRDSIHQEQQEENFKE